jgi:hypothetical protein
LTGTPQTEAGYRGERLTVLVIAGDSVSRRMGCAKHLAAATPDKATARRKADSTPPLSMMSYVPLGYWAHQIRLA